MPITERPSREQVAHIERRIDLLVRVMSILMGCDDLEEDPGMECVVQFRHEHLELKRVLQATDMAVKWAIRCAIAIIASAVAWIALNITTIFTLVESARHH